MRLPNAFTPLLAILALAGCDKNAVRDLTAPLPSAAIRFFNFGVNSPGVHFYAGDTKVTATTSTSCQAAANPPVTATDSACLTTGIESTLGVAYPGIASGGLYSGIAPGQYTLTGRITAAVDRGLAISSVPATIEAGKTSFTLNNVGQEEHEMFLARINEGYTFDEAIEAEGEEGTAERIGGIKPIDPGEESKPFSTNLKPGHYGMLCFVSGPEGQPHFMLGQKAEFDVE